MENIVDINHYRVRIVQDIPREGVNVEVDGTFPAAEATYPGVTNTAVMGSSVMTMKDVVDDQYLFE